MGRTNMGPRSESVPVCPSEDVKKGEILSQCKVCQSHFESNFRLVSHILKYFLVTLRICSIFYDG